MDSRLSNHDVTFDDETKSVMRDVFDRMCDALGISAEDVGWSATPTLKATRTTN